MRPVGSNTEVPFDARILAATHRELEAEIVTARRATGDPNLHLLDGPDLFGPEDVDDLPDGLHPNPAGYQRSGERFHQLVFEDGRFGT